MTANIDFEHPAPIASACVACGAALTDAYWEANGRVACGPCKGRLDELGREGFSASRFARAAAFGAAALVAGAILWWAVALFLHLQAALVTLAIGWGVGTAVRMGAGGHGGVAYQCLAVGQTYLSVVLAHVLLLAGQLERAEADSLGASRWPLLVAVAFVAPFLGGPRSILTLVIIGAGLVTAWRKNAPVVIRWTGPHPIGAAPAPASLPPLPASAPPRPPDGG